MLTPEERARNQELRSRLISETYLNHPHYGPDNGQVAEDPSMDDTAETREAIKKQGVASSLSPPGDELQFRTEEGDEGEDSETNDLTLSEARKEYKTLTGKAPNAKWSADHISKLIDEEKAAK